MRFVVVTGMSGGGKSTAMKMLEDMGYYCVDNLPVLLIEKFAELVAKSKKIICRGGYSSLMDLITLNRNAYLVPTPGQTEQEYLAEYLTKEGLFNYCKQKDFKLKNINIPDIEIKRYFDSDC